MVDYVIIEGVDVEKTRVKAHKETHEICDRGCRLSDYFPHYSL